jgi:hypothetical protein
MSNTDYSTFEFHFLFDTRDLTSPLQFLPFQKHKTVLGGKYAVEAERIAARYLQDMEKSST